jgi:regulator of protease activity HflC (stomatin/prohibitin superfamily)
MRSRQIDHLSYQTGAYGDGSTGSVVRWGRKVVVNEWERGLLFRDGRLVTVLEPGAHRRWALGHRLRAIDLRPWVLLVPTQEIPTADGVTVKATVAGQARVTDPTTYVTAARDSDQTLYLAVQVALREVVAATTVEDLLTGRADLGAQLVARVRGLDERGLAVDQLELRDIVLPSELKRAQSELLVARAKAAADLERARGETAALRSLANAARLASDNPTLLQLRTLQVLEHSTGNTFVLGTSPLGVATPPGAASAPREGDPG